jgi:hypothetical protein
MDNKKYIGMDATRFKSTGSRSNPAVLRQHKLIGNMVLAEGTINFMQRLSHLPTAPHFSPLVRGKLQSSRLHHKHHL